MILALGPCHHMFLEKLTSEILIPNIAAIFLEALPNTVDP
jgi:hypothetical protein